MGIHDLSKILCWLLRNHKWRRLHKDEWARGVPICFEPGQDGQVRICRRCQNYRFAKKRNHKQNEQSV